MSCLPFLRHISEQFVAELARRYWVIGSCFSRVAKDKYISFSITLSLDWHSRGRRVSVVRLSVIAITWKRAFISVYVALMGLQARRHAITQFSPA
jgi:hypothetical protein